MIEWSQKSKLLKIPRASQQNPKKSLDQKLAPKKPHTEFPESIKWYNTKNKNIRNWKFVFVSWPYHLKLSYAGTSTNPQIVLDTQNPLLK